LLPSFVEPTTFSLENALFALFAVNRNWMQDRSTHPSKNHPPKHPTPPSLANNLPMASLFTRLLRLFRQSNLQTIHFSGKMN